MLILPVWHMKEGDNVDIVWVTAIEHLNIFKKAPIDPLKAVDKTSRLQRGAEIEKSNYDFLTRFRVSKSQHKIDK